MLNSNKDMPERYKRKADPNISLGLLSKYTTNLIRVLSRSIY